MRELEKEIAVLQATSGQEQVSHNLQNLQKEEGEHGLIHVGSRAATYRVQFIQRLLYGAVDLVWGKKIFFTE